MGQKNRGDKIRLKHAFALVSRVVDTGEMVLGRSMTPLQSVLDDIRDGYPDVLLFARHKGIERKEISAARAWLVRFGADAANPSSLPPGPKGLLLDENTPYCLLPRVSALFGMSSHVDAEGLACLHLADQYRDIPRSQIDSTICDFAAAQEFRGILTCDTDFRALYQDRNHSVRKLHVVLVDRHNQNNSIAARIERFADVLVEQINTRPPNLIVI